MRITKLFTFLFLLLAFASCAQADPMTIDLDTMLPHELDALIELAKQEKEEATDFPSSSATFLSDQLRQSFEKMLPDDAEASYPFFGFDKTRSREMHRLSGDITVKYADKSKKKFDSVTAIYWLDTTDGQFHLAAFFDDTELFSFDEAYYSKSLIHLDNKTIERIGYTTSVPTSDPLSISAAATFIPHETEYTAAPTATPTAIPSPTPTVKLTATPSPAPTHTPPPATTKEPVAAHIIATKSVNIRQDASTESKKLGTLAKGDKLVLLQAFYMPKWHQVEYNGQVSYISANYCDIVDGVIPAAISVASAKTSAPTQVKKQESSSAYIGNRNTKKFHYASCSSVDDMKSSNKVSFASSEEAKKKGYVPCKRCKP